MQDQAKTKTQLLEDLQKLRKGYEKLQKRQCELEQSNEQLLHEVDELSQVRGFPRGQSSDLSLDKILTSTGTLIRSVLAPDLVLVYLVEGDRLVLQQVPDHVPRFHELDAQIKPVGKCLCGLAASNGEPVFSKDIHSDHRCTLPECKEAGMSSFAALPLAMGGVVFGVLGVASFTQRDFFSQAGLLESLAAHVSLAVQNARLYGQARSDTKAMRERLKSLKQAEEILQDRTRELDAKVKELNSLERIVQDRTGELIRSNEELQKEIAERRNTEKKLRESETRYRAIVEHQTELICRFTPDCRLTFANEAYCRHFGIKYEELMGKSFLDFIPPEDYEGVKAHLSSFSPAKPVDREEHRVITSEGAIRWQQWINSATFDDLGRVVGFQAVGRDVTDRKEAEQALREAHDLLELKVKERTASLSSINEKLREEIEERQRVEEALSEKEAKYRALFEQAAESICVVDVKGNRIVEFNRRAHEDLGYSRKEFQLLHISDLDVGLEPDTISLKMNRAVEKGTENFEAKLKSKFRDVRNVLVSCRPVDFGGKILYQTMCMDITERKRMEEDLRRSEERFRAIFEGARDAIFIKDAAFRYTHVNPGMQMLLGLDASQIIGRTDGEIFGSKAGEHTREVDLRVLNGQTVEEEHSRPVRGIESTFHDIRVPLRNPDGDIIGICGISRDITERRKASPALQDSFPEYESPAMKATLQEAHFAASTSSIVLLLGESGSGKDYLARWIHKHSPRANGPFFSINCAAVSKELAESELFGHEPGAFTGARGRKRGLLELAEGGTLLLNEIGELPLSLQSKLLTFLDTRSFMRVGGEKRIQVDARLIAATHRDLAKDVAEGLFLKPLFYRINVFSIRVPALRERLEDIPVLAREMVSRLAQQMQLSPSPTFDPSEMNRLGNYHWPGNVRELRNVLERAVMLSGGHRVRVSLPTAHREKDERYYQLRVSPDRTLREVMDEITRVLCVEALHHSDGNKRKAAQLLGTSRDSLYRYIERFGIDDKKLTP